MKTVEFKDLPNKVRGLIIRLNDSIYNEDYRIDLYCLHKWNKWSQATDEERLAYAEWRYKFGVRLKDAYDDEDYDLKLRSTIFYLEKDPRSPHDIMLTRNERHTDITIYDSDKNKWAEIISEPEGEEQSEIMFNSNDISDSEKKEIERMLRESKHKPLISSASKEPTFKAGDEVEVSHNGLIYNDENYFFTGGTTAKGLYICEGASKNGALYAFQHIRKPDPDKIYRAIAKEMMSKTVTHIFDGWSGEFNSIEDVELMLIEALKKGKSL